MEHASVRRQGFIDREKALRAGAPGTAAAVLRQFKALFVAIGFALLVYAAYVSFGVAAAPMVSGTLAALPLDAPIRIVRDARDITHIRAHTKHDLFFAQGYAEASDRLFQMDLMRRFIYGRLAEILGPLQLGLDEQNRYLDARDIAAREWLRLGVQERSALQAFSDGVNAAMRTQPLPVEFRLLLYQPERWKAQDSLAILLAVAASVSDWPGDVIARDRLWRELGARRFEESFPLSDGNYDLSRSRVAGSNAWAAGSVLTRSHHALIANDPHLDLYVPGIWYVIELHSPAFHAAGASVPGVPGVMLGHNEHIAWATTNALAATLSLFRSRDLSNRYWQTERFGVRFAASAQKRYYRAPEGFAFGDADARGAILVRWRPYLDARSPLGTILQLNAARDVSSALDILSHYPGPPQNFVLADDRGMVAYHLAGAIPNDPAWGRYVHADASMIGKISSIPYEQLPGIAPSRTGIVISANNKMYGSSYRYRLSAGFAPPYRAFRIAQLLRMRKRYDIAYFARMQMDAFSAIDREFAHRIALYGRAHPDVLPESTLRVLAAWDGNFSPASRTATLEHALRVNAIDSADAPYRILNDLRRGRLPEEVADSVRSTVGLDWRETLDQPWSQAGAVKVAHPLGLLGMPFLNGYTLPGFGDEQTLHVQSPGFAQSFRAVWEIGDWDAGGIAIPSGESGYPGSGHYTDLTRAWIAGKLMPLPFSDAAVRKATRATLTLQP